MDWVESVVGVAAALCTTVANLPQLLKAWRTRETKDISLKMLLVLCTGVGLWLVYGLLKSDWFIIVANGASLSMLLAILTLKIMELRSSQTRG